MRRYFTFVSVIGHGVAAAALLVAQVFAAGPLPTPRRALVFEEARLVRLAEIKLPPQRRSPASAEATVSANAAPLDAPHEIREETGLESTTRIDPAPGIVAGVERGEGGVVPLGAVERAPVPPPAADPPAQGPIRLHSGIVPPRKIVNVPPVYPALARSAHIQGVIVLDAVIDTDGTVTAVRVLRPLPILDEAAVEAVRQWKYTPALANGRPVAVVMTVTINFSLAQ